METAFRITKYNPLLRDNTGKYLKDEWTSFSDVGKYFNGTLFDIYEYYEIESKYVRAIQILLEGNCVDTIRVSNLEKFDVGDKMDDSLKELYNKIESNSAFDLNEIDNIIKLILREYIWCELESLKGDIKIKFGYDYYMYFSSKRSQGGIVGRIQDIGLYVE